MGTFFGTVVRRRTIGGLVAIEKTHAGGEHLPMHAHERPYLTLVLQGRYDEQHENGCVVCAAPAVIVHPAGEAHANRFVYGDARLVALELQPGMGPELDAVCRRRIEISGGVVQGWLGRLKHELRQSDDASELAIRGCLWSLAAVLMRQAATPAPPPWLVDARARIDHGPLEDLAPQRLAAALCVPTSQMMRQYRAWYGQSLQEALAARRLADARVLLERDVPLAEIAAHCGFADQSHFTRAFGRVYGLPPGRYRASLRQDIAAARSMGIDEASVRRTSSGLSGNSLSGTALMHPTTSRLHS
jgi:AraC family transcriptional regulator